MGIAGLILKFAPSFGEKIGDKIFDNIPAGEGKNIGQFIMDNSGELFGVLFSQTVYAITSYH